MKTNMKHILIGILGISLLGAVGFMVNQRIVRTDTVSSNGIMATIYKSPSCGCCGQYASYLENKGYDITIEGVSDMQSIKEQYDIPYELESCHTMEIGGYVVEGHVPEEAVVKLLAEKPDIKGIGMAGMPSGSPGMPGPKNEDFVIYQINHDGTQGDIFMTI